eukprot:snap_masked-scaffold_33-processed-gene-1.7-mRNA-1 protein AED:0.39 eAED:0.39 QI:0/-1/0/1/-1/1/1/0/146
MKRGVWSKSEDKILLNTVLSHLGEKANQEPLPKLPSWTFIRKYIRHRSIKQCRERWVTAVCPDINKRKFSIAEDRRILELRDLIGNKWALIAYLLNTKRSHSLVKNRYKYLLRNEFYIPDVKKVYEGEKNSVSKEDFVELVSLLSK